MSETAEKVQGAVESALQALEEGAFTYREAAREEGAPPVWGEKAERFAAAARTLREAVGELHEALKAAHQHLEYCGYGDSWERGCALEEGLPEQIESALATAHRLTEADE